MKSNQMQKAFAQLVEIITLTKPKEIKEQIGIALVALLSAQQEELLEVISIIETDTTQGYSKEFKEGMIRQCKNTRNANHLVIHKFSDKFGLGINEKVKNLTEEQAKKIEEKNHMYDFVISLFEAVEKNDEKKFNELIDNELAELQKDKDKTKTKDSKDKPILH